MRRLDPVSPIFLYVGKTDLTNQRRHLPREKSVDTYQDIDPEIQ